jgi:ribonuclease Y
LIGRTLTSAKAEADRLLEVARSEGETAREKAELEAEKRILEKRAAFDEEAERTRAELRDQEKRLTKREDQLDRKFEQITSKEDSLEKRLGKLEKREAAIEETEAEVERLRAEQEQELLRVAALSKDEATARVMSRIEEDSRHDAAKRSREILEHAESEAYEEAREITLQAIQRYASETSAESTVRAVEIPSDDMKGRLIGREGRNIRAFERASGVDLIIDDTPGVIVVSCFDKVRQAIATQALQTLISDGRIHPTRIEEVLAAARKDVEKQVRKHGKEAVVEANLRGVHPKVSEAMGKLHFRTSYGQNVLRHSLEVAYLSQIIADQLGLDGALARRCGFLHDIGKAMDHEMEGGHPKIGMDFAKQHGEKEPVLNAIGGHHGDIPATSFYTPIVMAADAVSGARPGARRESLERYIQRLEQLQGIALEHEGVTEAHAIQAGREVRVMVNAERVGDDEAHLIARKIADRVAEEMTFPGEIKVTVLRETRAIEIAR